MDHNGKLTVLDPHGQPSGIFGRRLDATSNPRAILDPFEQPSGEIKPMTMAARLNSLDGKTVYLVETGFGGSFEFMQELQEWFARNMPRVKTVIRHKRGTMFTDDPQLWNEIKSSGGDAAILGVGGWEACSASVADYATTLEDEHGIPTAPLVTARFADFVERNARARGTPLRFGYPPYPVVGMSRAVLRGYIEGSDPITSKPFMQEVIEALTSPLTEGEKHPTIVRKQRRPRLLPADTGENLYRTFVERGWTDGLPIVLPTEERVAEMLTGTDHAPDEIVGSMIITTHQEKNEYTVEKVAAIAVMAGARPEHFPVILALAASQEPSMPSSTTSWGRMMIVNGPIRNEIGMNCGTAALSPFNLANSVIGRAWTLMSINFGDARAGENFMATFGHNLNYNNMCCGEYEELSPFEPFHVQKGFRADESVVSLFRGWNMLNFGMGPAKEMAHVIATFGGMYGNVTFVVDPLVAKNLRAEGFGTKQEAAKWIVENSHVPAGHFWEGQMQAGMAAGLAAQGIEPFASWAKLPKDAPLAPRRSPDDINFIVVGGETNPMWITTDFMHTRSFSIDKWRPKGGLRRDATPLRMPAPVTCKDGTCGIPAHAPSAAKPSTEPVTAD